MRLITTPHRRGHEPLPTPIIVLVRCAPKKAPRSECGTRAIANGPSRAPCAPSPTRPSPVLEITYGEYAARRGCRTTFRNSPEGVLPKAHYDNKVRDLVLDRLLKYGMSIERALASIRREFLLDLSAGFVYDVLRDHAASLDMAAHRRTVLDRFSGTLCVDELHLGRFTLLLATDPIADPSVGFTLVGKNDVDHMRRFLMNLKARGGCPGAWSPTARTSTPSCWPGCGPRPTTSCASSMSSRQSTGRSSTPCGV